MEYPEVWFLGMDSKKVMGDSNAALNSGMYASSICLYFCFVLFWLVS